MRVLLINGQILREIAAAVARAEAHPITLSFVRAGAIDPDKFDVELADRKPGFERPPSQHVLIPVGFRAAFSIEEQPAGFCRHLSVSIDRPGRLPSVEHVRAISDAYGIKNWDKVWTEEFDPGHRAVNVLELYRPRAEGKA